MIKKSFWIFIITISVISISLSQGMKSTKLRFGEINPFTKNAILNSDLHNFSLRRDSLNIEPKYTGGKKSPGLAMIYSLLVPGTGQLYAKRFDVGKYYMISEAALWLGFASFTIYGNWLLTDAHKFAQIHASIDPNGKDDNFFVNISNYDNVYQYNDEQLRFGNYNKLYDPLNGYYFYWDNVSNREKYRVDQLAGNRVITDRLFFAGAIIINHIISAISAVILTNSYNDHLNGSNGGFTINADVMRYGTRINGLQLMFCKWF